MTKGEDFFNDADTFDMYMRGRQRHNSPNATLEKPVIDELIGDVNGLRVLDLGCGDGQYGVQLLDAGVTQYTGIEPAQRMFTLADETLAGKQAEVVHIAMEDWNYPQNAYDLVISRLALHYVDDVAAVFENIHSTLVTGGRLVLSVVHPVITSCNRARGEDGSGLRQDWIVDDYFITGAREVPWLGSKVVQYHRTVEQYVTFLQYANFRLMRLRESAPDPAQFDDETLMRRRQRIPLFLFLSGEAL